MIQSLHVIRRVIILSCVLSLVTLPAHAVDDDPLEINLDRLSPRVLVLRHGTAYTTQVVAIATEKGIVVVDTTYMPSMAQQLRTLMEKEFGRDDFAYVINTHFHPDHTFGNAVFPEAKVIAHASTKSNMLENYGDTAAYRDQMKNNLQAREKALETLEPGSPLYDFNKQGAALFARLVEDLGNGFVLRTPDIEFVDELNLDLGDLNIHLERFGDNLHTTTDIFIHLPEEGVLMTGDLFAKEWLPEISPNQSVAEQIALLEKAYSDYASVKVVIPAHFGDYDPEYFRVARDYFAKLYKAVKDLKDRGRTLEELKQELTFDSAFPELTGLKTDFMGMNFHVSNIETVWKELEGSR